MATDPIALIEEKIDTKLKELLSSYEPSYTLGSINRDEINKRFIIHANNPLPEFDTAGGKAYEASDNANPMRQIYAMVLYTHYNYRNQTIEAMIGTQHAHLVAILESAHVHISTMGATHRVLIIDKPAGKRLSDVVAIQRINNEQVIKDSIIIPLSKAIVALRDRQIVHGCINLNTVFISDTLQLGECVSAPQGINQHYLYEALERIMATPIAKGGGNEKSDVYAIAVLTYELLYGLDHLKRIPKEDFVRLSLDQGVYNLFANKIDFSDSFQDFFRGALNDNPLDRWGIEQFMQWLAGKRFNMINPLPPREAVRPISFGGDDFYSQRILAHSFHSRWREALKEIRQMKLDRWAEMSLHRPELSESIARVIRAAGSESQASEKQNNELMTRIICIIDPVGSLRTLNLAVRPNGMGFALMEFIRHNNTNELQQLLHLIEQDIPNFWGESSPLGKFNEYSTHIWRLQRARVNLRIKTLGFGLERALYDLNPALPCQSPLVLPYHITTLVDMLQTLDVLAKSLAPDTSLVDRHIAAFIAAKLNMGKEIRLHDLAAIPELVDNQELIMLRILAKAQQKGERILLPGLCAWIGMRMEKMIDNIHNRAFRKRMKLQLKGAASSGYINEMFGIISNRDIAIRDCDGFLQAVQLYHINAKRIDKLQNPKVVERLSNDLGGRIASTMAYVILSITIYIVMSDYLGW